MGAAARPNGNRLNATNTQTDFCWNHHTVSSFRFVHLTWRTQASSHYCFQLWRASATAAGFRSASNHAPRTMTPAFRRRLPMSSSGFASRSIDSRAFAALDCQNSFSIPKKVAGSLGCGLEKFLCGHPASTNPSSSLCPQNPVPLRGLDASVPVSSRTPASWQTLKTS